MAAKAKKAVETSSQIKRAAKPALPAIAEKVPPQITKPEGCYKLGTTAIPVPLTLHAENRERLCERLKGRKDYVAGSIVLLCGGESTNRYCTDTERLFRQESYFHWAFGVLEPDFLGAIEVDSARAILFAPRLPPSYAVWMGAIETPDEIRTRYLVAEVHFVDEINKILNAKQPSELLLLHGANTDSGSVCRAAHFDGIDMFKTNRTSLHPEISECRVHKTDAELAVMRYVNRVSSEAHVRVMRAMRPGLFEYQAESMFKDYTYRHGACRHDSYTCICASGPNPAVLHYGHAGRPNDRLMKAGETVLFDMGGEYYCYASDITVCYPVSGKFSEGQRFVYETVLAANRAVLRAVKPGVAWADMHLLAERTILEALKARGCLTGDVNAMLEARLGAVFMPHGLGHFLGLDVHDVGGYNSPLHFHLPAPDPASPHASAEKPEGRVLPRILKPGLKSLRTVRLLEERMVLTIEPGLYFNDATLKPAYEDAGHKQFLVREAIERVRAECSGVRIEDDVLVTSTGAELLTRVPRAVADIERLMAEARSGRLVSDDEEVRICRQVCQAADSSAARFYKN